MDPDFHLLSMFVRRDRRKDFDALVDFYHEIAKTRAVVTETQLGLIRLQWWRDEIGKIYARDTYAANDILQALHKAINKHHLPQEDFNALVYGREFDLEDRLPAHFDGMKSYACFTMAPLLRLMLRVVGETAADTDIDAVAARYGIARILRAALYHLSARRCYLPADMLAAAGTDPDHLYAGQQMHELSGVIADIAGKMPPAQRSSARLLRRVNKLADVHIAALRDCGFDIRDARLQSPPPFAAIKVFIVGI